MKKSAGNALKLFLSLGLGIGLIYWFVGKMSDEDIRLTKDAFLRANYFWIFLAPVMGLISNFSRARRWIMLLEPTGHKPGFINTYCSIMLMYLFNLLFPRLGEVTRCSILARYENVPLDKSIGTMVVERLVDLLTIFIIGSFLLFVERDRLLEFFRENILSKPETTPAETNYIKWIVYGAVLVGVIVASVYFEQKYGFARFKQMIKKRLVGFIDGLKSIRNVSSPMEFVFHSVFIWICYFFMIYWSFPALVETSGMGVFAGMACLFFGGFAMVATPGGIGAYPLAISKVLALYGLNETLGYAFGSIVWVAQMGAVLLGGAICLVILAIINREPALE